MKLMNMSEGVTNWPDVPASRVPSTQAAANVRSRQIGEVQLRIVEYEPGYLADHWCAKGHVLYVVAGELSIEHEDGAAPHLLRAGMSWHIAEGENPAHRVRSLTGASVFIVD